MICELKIYDVSNRLICGCSFDEDSVDCYMLKNTPFQIGEIWFDGIIEYLEQENSDSIFKKLDAKRVDLFLDGQLKKTYLCNDIPKSEISYE